MLSIPWVLIVVVIVIVCTRKTFFYFFRIEQEYRSQWCFLFVQITEERMIEQHMYVYTHTNKNRYTVCNNFYATCVLHNGRCCLFHSRFTFLFVLLFSFFFFHWQLSVTVVCIVVVVVNVEELLSFSNKNIAIAVFVVVIC